MRYFNALRNQLNIARGWMFTTLIMTVFCAYLLMKLTAATLQTPVRLVPQNFDSMNGYVEVSQKDFSDLEYITAIAVADLQYFTDWTPRTVKSQHSRFVNRMTPSLYAKEGVNLLINAEAHAKSERTQAFFINDVQARKNEVSILGTLEVWQGQERVSNARMTYTLKYTSISGLPKFVSFSAAERR